MSWHAKSGVLALSWHMDRLTSLYENNPIFHMSEVSRVRNMIVWCIWGLFYLLGSVVTHFKVQVFMSYIHMI